MMQNITTPFEFSIEIESLYIAHVFPNINKKRIAQLFEKLNLAKISGIDFVSKIGKDRKPYNSAYIHIDYWFDNVSARHFQEKIRSDAKESLLVYDDPWYWIVNENISSKKTLFIEMTEDQKQMEATNSLEMYYKEFDKTKMEDEENNFSNEIQVAAEIDNTNDNGIECYKLLLQVDKKISSILNENKRLKQELKKNL